MKFDRLKSGQPVTTDWRTINTLLGSVESLDLRVNRLEHPYDRAWQNIKARPFEIYATSSWLKYKVRTGYVITTGDPVVPTDVEVEFTITSGVARYWFYLDLSTTPTVLTDTTTPTWSVQIIPIGWVDTNTYSASTSAIIHQFLDDNVFVPCA